MRTAALALVLLLAACGQSGDLYLPDAAPATAGGGEVVEEKKKDEDGAEKQLPERPPEQKREAP